ncbi:MAG TPA: hypothetical protein VML55_22130 [Planctomycetaceae bacterium]|nr:hypothetical protein [Planctomycetaceae bacterium]
MGFITNDRGPGFKSVLLAAVPPGGKLTFVGTLLAEELPSEVRDVLAERMPPLVRFPRPRRYRYTVSRQP